MQKKLDGSDLKQKKQLLVIRLYYIFIFSVNKFMATKSRK